MATYRPLLIAALVLTEVGLWQWRVLIAARGGDVQAREEAQTLAPTLTEAQRAEARQAAADFQTGE